MIKRKIIAIVGPTATGKTGIGVRVAKEFNGEIISADSRQVFRGLDIGSGKEGRRGQKVFNFQFSPLRSTNYEGQAIFNKYLNDKYSNDQINEKWKMINEKLRPNLRYIDDIPQWLIDIKNPGEDFNLFEFLELANLAIEDIFSREKTPIIVGGTGLYIQGLVEGFRLNQKLNVNPTSLAELRGSRCRKQHSREQLEEMSREELNKVLEELDKEAYDLVDKNNPHRLIRAIERAQDGFEMVKVKPDYEVLQIGINWPKEVLCERINRRVDDRFDQGMLLEVQGLLKQGVDPNWLIKLGLEYREITQYLLNHESRIVNQEEQSHPKSTQVVPSETEGSVYASGFIEIPKQVQNGKDFQEMSQTLKLRIRQFAKRQTTWFKRFPEIVWENDYEEIKKFIVSLLAR